MIIVEDKQFNAYIFSLNLADIHSYYFHICFLLTDLAKKKKAKNKQTFSWERSSITIVVQVLKFPNINKQYILKINASDYAF